MPKKAWCVSVNQSGKVVGRRALSATRLWKSATRERKSGRASAICSSVLVSDLAFAASSSRLLLRNLEKSALSCDTNSSEQNAAGANSDEFGSSGLLVCFSSVTSSASRKASFKFPLESPGIGSSETPPDQADANSSCSVSLSSTGRLRSSRSRSHLAGNSAYSRYTASQAPRVSCMEKANSPSSSR